MRIIVIILLSALLLVGCGSLETEQPIAGADPELEHEKTTINVTTDLDILHSDGKTTFNFSLTNEEAEEIELYFSSGQQYEIIITNEQNEVVYQYSEGKMFTMALLEKRLGAGESLNWSEEWNQQYNGVQVPNGEYHVSIEIMGTAVEEFELSELTRGQSITIHNEIEEVEGEGQEDSTPTQPNYENNAFRNIEITGDNGVYTITGEARVYEAVYRYAVSDGHAYLIDDFETVAEGGPSWSEFTLEISLTQQQLPVNGTITLELFEDSAKDGSRVNELIIPLDTIGQ